MAVWQMRNSEPNYDLFESTENDSNAEKSKEVAATIDNTKNLCTEVNALVPAEIAKVAKNKAIIEHATFSGKSGIGDSLQSRISQLGCDFAEIYEKLHASTDKKEKEIAESVLVFAQDATTQNAENLQKAVSKIRSDLKVDGKIGTIGFGELQKIAGISQESTSSPVGEKSSVVEKPREQNAMTIAVEGVGNAIVRRKEVPASWGDVVTASFPGVGTFDRYGIKPTDEQAIRYLGMMMKQIAKNEIDWTGDLRGTKGDFSFFGDDLFFVSQGGAADKYDENNALTLGNTAGNLSDSQKNANKQVLIQFLQNKGMRYNPEA